MTKDEIEAMQTELATLKATAETLTQAATLRAQQDKERAKLDSVKEGSVFKALQGNRAKVQADLDAQVAKGSKDPLADLAKTYDEYASLFSTPAQKPADPAPNPADLAAATPQGEAPNFTTFPTSPLSSVFAELRQKYAANLALG